jgi:hypothetical protein
MCRVGWIISKTFIVSLMFVSCFPVATHSRSPLQHEADRSAHLPALSLRHLQRCAGVRGSICSSYYAQSLQQLQQPRVFDKLCPINAHTNTPCGLGVCHGDTGLCDCPAGMHYVILLPSLTAALVHVLQKVLLSAPAQQKQHEGRFLQMHHSLYRSSCYLNTCSASLISYWVSTTAALHCCCMHAW